MNTNITLKEALNRQFVALNSFMPIERGLFSCRRATGLGEETPSVSFKPFERAYPIYEGTHSQPLEAQ